MIPWKSIEIDGSTYSPEGLLLHAARKRGEQELPDWEREVWDFLARLLDPEDPELWQLSSGTTGDPKRFMLSRQAMYYSAQRSLDFFGLKKGDRLLSCLPVRYIAGKMMLVRALAGGLELVLTEPSSRPLASVDQRPGPGSYTKPNPNLTARTSPAARGFDLAALVPLQVHNSLSSGDELNSCKRLLIGGGELYGPDREELRELRDTEVWESFGMSETYTHIALRRVNGPLQDPCFLTMEGVGIDLDERGCLVIRDRGLSEKDIVTNDLAELMEGGGFRWLGRYDNLINSGGIKLIPELLEEKISVLLKKAVLLLAEPDERLGQRTVLLVEDPEASSVPAQTQEQMAHHVQSILMTIKEQLMRYELPSRIVIVDRLPRNANLKPDRTSAGELLL